MQALSGVLLLLLTIQYVLAGKRRFELNIEPTQLNPDCFNQSYASLTINGQYPGPTLRMVKNDKIEVLVKNSPKNNVTTSIHFHGIYQLGSNSADGVAGITQLPIEPGQEFLHEFQIINQTGTFYYHAHVGVQDDTVQGSLIVYETEEALAQAEKEMLSDGTSKIREGPYEYDEERILHWSEWWHQSVYDREDFYTGSKFTGDGGPDSFLLNGQSVYNSHSVSDQCQGFPVIDLKPNRVYRLRFIGALTFRMLGIMIPHHNMTLIELDSEYVQPLYVDHVELVPGRRISVLLKTGNYTDGTLFPITSYYKWKLQNSDTYTPNGYGFIRYVSDDYHASEIKIAKKPDQLPKTIDRDSAGWVLKDVRPYVSGDPAILSAKPTRTLTLAMRQRHLPDNTTRFENNGRIHQGWGTKTMSLLDQIELDPDFGELSPLDGFSVKHQTYPMNVGDIIDIVFQNMRNPTGDCVAHPWHTHGHAHYLMAEGKGKYVHARDKDIVTFQDPIKQDVSMQYPDEGKGPEHCGWTKIRLHVDNPGVWAVHCHITAHMLQGKIVVFEISPKLAVVPEEESDVRDSKTADESEEDDIKDIGSTEDPKDNEAPIDSSTDTKDTISNESEEPKTPEDMKSDEGTEDTDGDAQEANNSIENQDI
ncbi:hypothetical protein G6F56_005717 [Rhizopus delemar]|nr:hypothetical protein G6F56_005717 [Rhizopus delemar]